MHGKMLFLAELSKMPACICSVRCAAVCKQLGGCNCLRAAQVLKPGQAHLGGGQSRFCALALFKRTQRGCSASSSVPIPAVWVFCLLQLHGGRACGGKTFGCVSLPVGRHAGSWVSLDVALTELLPLVAALTDIVSGC